MHLVKSFVLFMVFTVFSKAWKNSSQKMVNKPNMIKVNSIHIQALSTLKQVNLLHYPVSRYSSTSNFQKQFQ
jgi:hypothetical protein